MEDSTVNIQHAVKGALHAGETHPPKAAKTEKTHLRNIRGVKIHSLVHSEKERKCWSTAQEVLDVQRRQYCWIIKG